jgi:photosystem II stability/assembly factor-like uncharacterized protein
MKQIQRSLWLAGMLLANHLFAQLAPGALDDLRWRNVGPHRAGWATVAAGDPAQKNVYYFGAAGGGVWKTADAGQTWRSIFDDMPASSIGALALAPSQPQTLYVGTGQVNSRYDLAAGRGVFKSTDGGAHWSAIGLENTRHIGAISVHPTNPNDVLVAALGHYYGPNKERGVFRSIDGGKTWQHSLFVNENTGAVSLARDAIDPKIIYAATWQARNYPWMSYFTPVAGEGSGVYVSHDDGAHWSRLAGGFPQGADVGRIGLASARVGKSSRLYAVVQSKTLGGLYQSSDRGKNWRLVNSNKGLASGYVANITVSPSDPNTIYIMGRSMQVSTDGGKTLSFFRGSPGGDDYHALWINPAAPNFMIAGSDQGAAVSVNGGDTWSSWYNQATGQFYHLAVDNQFPYWIYSGQQDNGSVAITSRSDYGQITFRDWHPVGADERDDDLPDPENPNIIYGSGLGGRISKWDALTGNVQNITPAPMNTYGLDPRTITFRYSWITPLEFGLKPPYPLYMGAQVLFKSNDRGAHWEQISPDLTSGSPVSKACPGKVEFADAKACGFGVIFNIAPSPFDNNEVWVGSDSGLIHRTRDGGKSWENLTPIHIPAWGKISRIDLSSLDRKRAYVAVDLHRTNHFEPLLLKTDDAGQTWTDISQGIPIDEITSVIRADKVRPGLLFAGTDRSVYFSTDDGEHWQSMRQNLPTAWVRDLLVKNDDVVIATQGRALWILDNISRLRDLAGQSAMDDDRLFPPAQAVRVRQNQNRDTPLPPETPAGENPPQGAILEYYLAKPAKNVSLNVYSTDGGLVASASSEDKAPVLPADQYFHNRYINPQPAPGKSVGAHRWLWNLRYPRPLSPSYEYSIGAVAGKDNPVTPEGPFVLPGEYKVELVVDAQKFVRPLRVVLDPRLKVNEADLRAIRDFNLQAGKTLAELTLFNQDVQTALEKATTAKEDERRSAFESLQTGAPPDQLGLASLVELLPQLVSDTESAEAAPTNAQVALLNAYQNRLHELLAAWKKLQ